MITSIIVDDELRAIKALQITLEKHCSEVSVIGIAKNVNEAKELIIKLRPELIFLDINLPGRTGLDLLRDMQDLSSKIIFITAYEEYLVDALRLSAFDYLLKPVDKTELKEAIERLKSHMIKKHKSQIEILSSFLNDESPKRIAINTIDELEIVNIDDIVYLSSDKNYTKFHLAHSEIIASKPLGTYDEMLISSSFYRVHRSFVVNLNQVKSFKKRDLLLIMSNGDEVDVSKRKKEELLLKLHR